MDQLARCQALLKRSDVPDKEAMQRTQARLDRLTKPQGSLGKLEQVAVKLAGIYGELPPAPLRKVIAVMAGDHGVCEEGVSAFPQDVTAQMALNFVNGGAAVNVLARHVGADVVCVDMGMREAMAHERLFVRAVRRGTGNIARGPAMTRDEAVQAVEAGIGFAEELIEQGYRLLATGEMGIGNTTPSAAMLAVLGGIAAEQAVGRGTGVDDAGLARKKAVVKQAIANNAADPGDPLDVLAKLGGLEIAGLTGFILGAAAGRCPIVIDGFIASVAALTACRLAPQSRAYMIASHLSEESGHRYVLELLGLKPMLHMDMRLGEGTGAALGMSIIDAAIKIVHEMATFEDAGVSVAHAAQERNI